MPLLYVRMERKYISHLDYMDSKQRSIKRYLQKREWRDLSTYCTRTGDYLSCVCKNRKVFQGKEIYKKRCDMDSSIALSIIRKICKS